mmetsp:Transcript_5730/g.14307  ORF Transcript_5730/g.14307 Transcript_5730/m.14307 type:complete len:617 (+) Transcript_5730:77-1927(+)
METGSIIREDKTMSIYHRRTVFRKAFPTRAAGSMRCLIIHLALLIYSVMDVRSFTPHTKRYIIPKYSNLEVTENDNNGDVVNMNSDASNGFDQINSDNSTSTSIMSPQVKESFPLNSLTSSGTTPMASPKNKIPIKNKKGIKVDNLKDRKMDLMWCQSDRCQDVVRERVVGEHNTIVFNGPATGQVAYRWNQKAYPNVRGESERESLNPAKSGALKTRSSSIVSSSTQIAKVLLMVKKDDETLLQIAAQNVPELTRVGIEVLLAPELAAKLKHYYGVDDERISLFEQPKDPNDIDTRTRYVDEDEEEWVNDMHYSEPFPDLVVTLGGDGLLMYASSVFQGPIPPLLAISGGSLGFLTAFEDKEMTAAIKVALGMATPKGDKTNDDIEGTTRDVQFSSFEEEKEDALQVFPPNMPSYPYQPAVSDTAPKFTFGVEDFVCMTIRMRLDCRVVSREGAVRARYNVLNEVVIDRGSSPYLAALECFCDDVHLTTVQADGVIFATPSGSTAYSMAAGGSVVHPAVPCILVTPICPHVLSFRSMVFPDHVVLRCFVPDDARATASVAFDGKHRHELQRGDSVQIQMSAYPVPTINKGNHSSDWLESLKNSFNFNTRARQKPL